MGDAAHVRAMATTSFRKGSRVIAEIVTTATSASFTTTRDTRRLPGVLTGRKRTLRGTVQREVLVDETVRAYPWASTEWVPDTRLQVAP